MENFGEFVVSHWILWTLFFGLLAFLIGSTVSSNIGGAVAVNTAQAVQIVNQKKGVFIDTRDKVAFDKEHIGDSVNMPLSGFTAGTASMKGTSKPVIVVSGVGQNTSVVVKQLQTDGVTDIYVLKGGLNTWKESKLPLFN
jgi:rhodanese-related sulfurtransferase